jgi:hypothetical protein
VRDHVVASRSPKEFPEQVKVLLESQTLNTDYKAVTLGHVDLFIQYIDSPRTAATTHNAALSIQNLK